MKRWKLAAPPARTELIELELLRDIRALLYILALRGTPVGDVASDRRLESLEAERMEESDG